MAEIDYREFNKFQTAFYLNTVDFAKYTKFEIKKHGYVLLNNLAKGFPYLADIIINLKGIGWSAVESPALLQALQRRLMKPNTQYLPSYIYFKGTVEKAPKEKVKQTKDGLIFQNDVNKEIQSILMYDSKTFEYLKFTDQIQNLGREIIGESLQKEKVSSLKKLKKGKS